MADEDIKSITIPLSDINSIQSDGTMLLRYRVISKDKNRKSHWSKVYNINPSISFSELNGFEYPILSQYQYSSSPSFYNIVSASSCAKSNIERNFSGNDNFTFSWETLSTNSNIKNYDVYLSWGSYSKSGSAVTLGEDVYVWTEYEYVGTTSSNKFSFKRNVSTYTIPAQTVSYSSPNLTITTSEIHNIPVGAHIYIENVSTASGSSAYNTYWETQAGTSGNVIVLSTSTNLGNINNNSGTVKVLYQKVSAILTESSYPKSTNMLNSNNIILSISDFYSPNDNRSSFYPFSIWNLPNVKTVQKRNRLNLNITPTKTGNYIRMETLFEHQYKKGDTIDISGTSVAAYNGTKTITAVGKEWFEYEDSTNPAVAFTETTRSTTGTISLATQDTSTGIWSATLSNLSASNTVAEIGLIIRGSAGTGNLGTGTIMVTNVLSATSVKIQSTSTISNGTVTNIFGANAKNNNLYLFYELSAPFNERISLENTKTIVADYVIFQGGLGTNADNVELLAVKTDFYGYQMTVRAPATIIDQNSLENVRL